MHGSLWVRDGSVMHPQGESEGWYEVQSRNRLTWGEEISVFVSRTNQTLVTNNWFLNTRNADGIGNMALEISRIQVFQGENVTIPEVYIGLDTGGRVVGNYGPISFLNDGANNSPHLVLRDSDWVRHCAFNSSIRVPVSVDDSTGLGDANFGLLHHNGTSTVVSFGDIVYQPQLISVHLGNAGSNTLIHVPRNMFERIESFALQNGWVRVDEGRHIPRYHSCSMDIVDTFPDLVIMWAESGYLFIPGREYIFSEPSTNTCRMRIRSLDEGDDRTIFNPLQFIGTNVRFQRVALEFCDPY